MVTTIFKFKAIGFLSKIHPNQCQNSKTFFIKILWRLIYFPLHVTYSLTLLWQQTKKRLKVVQPLIQVCGRSIEKRPSRQKVADTAFLYETWLRKFSPSLNSPVQTMSLLIILASVVSIPIFNLFYRQGPFISFAYTTLK